MNKETQKIIDFIESNEEYKSKMQNERKKVSNFKDFYNSAGYVIMDILNKEKTFYDYPRHKIELTNIVELYF